MFLDASTAPVDTTAPSHLSPLDLLCIPTVDTKLLLAARHHAHDHTLATQLAVGHKRIRKMYNCGDDEDVDLYEMECKSLRNGADVMVDLEAYHEAIEMYQQVTTRGMLESEKGHERRWYARVLV